MEKVVIVEDNTNIRNGLKILIDGDTGLSCSAVFSNCEDFLASLPELNPSIVLMDINLPGINGIEGIKKMKKIVPDVPVVILTIYEENEMIFDALCAGASGYLLKNTPPSRLIDAIYEALEGGGPMSSNIARKVIEYFNKPTKVKPSEEEMLSQRELEVLDKLVQGCTSKFIAESLFINIETVRFHYKNIYKKLHVHSKSEAVAKALKEGLV